MTLRGWLTGMILIMGTLAQHSWPVCAALAAVGLLLRPRWVVGGRWRRPWFIGQRWPHAWGITRGQRWPHPWHVRRRRR